MKQLPRWRPEFLLGRTIELHKTFSVINARVVGIETNRQSFVAVHFAGAIVGSDTDSMLWLASDGSFRLAYNSEVMNLGAGGILFRLPSGNRLVVLPYWHRRSRHWRLVD